ncbi:DNA-3-methyladenine glycosylase 2 [Phycicoccus flavus]|uniref:DNA-3-methyladenine glycosylase 2 n=1 Tax=Phycicoccus flavus TaxID=2502783 RepID=UPI000FEBEE86|nr:AlkA N-terminal domain-containing protein [Phycicoccus flavus]NHA69107.1 DNA-3-methyladenine glycosylase 2 family protein [Phycicoccus flavus]
MTDDGAAVVEERVEVSLDLAAVRAWLLAHAVPGVDAVDTGADGGTAHRRAVRAAAGRTHLTVVLPVTGRATLRAEGPGTAEALAAGRRWLGLDLDPADGAGDLAGDAVLGPLVTARPLVRVPGAPDPFEAAVNVVLGQHVSVAAGRVFAGRLAATHEVTPDALAAADPAALQADVGVTGGRALTLVALARAVADGLDLAPQPDAGRRRAVRAALLALPGVGPWTADLVAMRCLRDPDVFLPGDLVLRRALGGVTAREAAGLAEAWRPHRSLAVVHLWTHHALDPP